MYIFAWLQKKSRACDKHSSSLFRTLCFCLSAGEKKPPWTLSAFANIAGFTGRFKVRLFPAGSCFSTLKYIMRYNFYKRAWIHPCSAFTFAALPSSWASVPPLNWAEMRISISIKCLLCVTQNTPTLLNPSLASSLKLGIHRRFIWDAALSVRTTGVGKIHPATLNGQHRSVPSFQIQTSRGSFRTRSQHNWVCSQSARTKPAVAHTKLSLPQCCSPWLSLFAVSLEVLCQH